MPNISDTPFWRAKAILGDDSVILSRDQLLDLIWWVSMQPAGTGVAADEAFEMWVVDYMKRTLRIRVGPLGPHKAS